MKKQKTLLIVVLIVAIAMVGLYLAMGLMSGKEEKTRDNVKGVSMLTDMEDVTYLQYKNPEETVTLVKTDGAWKIEEKPELALLAGYVDEKVAELGKIEGEVVADAVKVDCGLEEPSYTLTVKNEKDTVKIVIGFNENGKYFAMVEGKEDIYEITEKVINILNMNADDYFELAGDVSAYDENLEKEAATDETATVTDEEVEEDVVDDTTDTEAVDDSATDGASTAE